MSSDLENELRDALHARAAAVTAADLRAAPTAGRRRPRVPGWALAAVAVVAAIAAVGVAVLAGDRDGTPPAGTGQPLAGTRWRVVAVTEQGHRVAITSRRVVVEFGTGGRFDADDGVNYYSGRWRLGAHGLLITDVGGTLAGYGGRDPAVLAAQRGIGAVTTGDGPVSAQRTASTLRLAAHGVVLDLVADGPAAGGGGAGSTPSPTATGSS